MDRSVLSDRQWARIAPLCLGKESDPGRTGGDARLFLEAVLFVARTGCPWRDLPAAFGNWNSVFQRFRRWAKRGVFDRIFKEISTDFDMEYVMIDGTIMRVHRPRDQLGQGAKGGRKNRPSANRAAA